MRWFVPLLALTAISCAGNGEIEGDDAGECSDGADNDQNGYFDCQDNGCWNSPDCTGETDTDTDADSDSDSDSDTDTDAEDCTDNIGPFSHITTMDVRMQLDVDLDETNPFCGPFGVGAAIKDCTMVWEGTADTVVERCRPPERITMEGTFSRTSSDCDLDPNDSQPAILEQGTWGNEDNPSSYISLVMSQADPGFLETVIGHKFITRWRPTESPVSDQQYYETDIPSVTFSNGQTVIDYVGTTIEPVKNCPITYTSTVRVDINQ